MKIRLHSVDTMGLVDGPGIRYVAFFQGCPLRCLYCHNPDTWSKEGGRLIEVQELFQDIKKYKTYFSKKGGLTCSGGEPLLQKEALLELLKLCKKEGIHTCLDTSGVGVGNYSEILKYTDLVLLDIKALNQKDYQKITRSKSQEFLKFKKALAEVGTPLWIRHVILPGINDQKEDIKKLEEYIQDIPNIEKIELLGYHRLGVSKYEELALDYPLKDLEDLKKEKLEELKKALE